MGNASTREEFGDALDRISREDIPPDDTEFWDSLWRIPSTTYEVFELIAPDDVRKWLAERPGNLATLFTQGVAQICQLVETPNPEYFRQALTCVRMLTRLMPFLLERQQDRFLDQLFWGTTMSVSDAQEEEEAENEPLAKMLIQSIYKLLFLPKFTVFDNTTEEYLIQPPEEGCLSYGNPNLIWKQGIGKEKTSYSTNQLDSNRREVLRLLIACMSEPLYQSPDGFDPYCSRWQQIATSASEPLVPTLFASLINTVTSFDPYGWGVPYGTQMVDDAPQKLMEVSLQALIILLDFGVPTNQASLHPAPGADSGATASPAVNANAYRRLFAQVKEPEHFDAFFNGVTRLLNNIHIAENTYLPGSYYKVECYQELLVLMWKMLEENEKFTTHILKFCDITQLMVPTCFLMFEARNLVSKVGLVHICTFLLLKLSGERSFGVLLNKEYDLRLPMDLPIFSGTHSDFLIITLQKIIVTGSAKLSPLYHCFLTIMCNISPYAKTLSLVTSVKLVNLLETFTTPKFFFSSESNHIFVALLLEIFNNIIQYQYSGNAHLVYAIVRRKEIFCRITHLSLPASVRAAQIPPGVTGTGGVDVDEGEGATEEPSIPSEQTNIVDTTEGPEDPPLPPSAESVSTPPPENTETKPAEVDENKEQNEEQVEEKPKEGQDNNDQKPEETKTNESNSENATSAPEESTPDVPGEASEAKEGAEATPPPPPAPEPGPAKFIPTEEWLNNVKAGLPINTVARLLTYLVPQVDEMCQSKPGGVDDVALMDFLKSTTMVGLLPVPHPIVIRKYQPNQFTGLWFTAYMWGVVFLRNHGLPIFDGDSIKLFVVTVN